MELFGYTIKKSKEEKEVEKLESFVQKKENDGAILLDDSINNAYTFNFDFGVSNSKEDELIELYRIIAESSDVEWAIDDIVNSVIAFEPDIVPLTIDLEQTELSENVQKKVKEEFDTILKLLDFRNKGDEIFRTWYVDGKYILHKIFDKNKQKDGIKELRYIEPTKIKKVREEKKDEKNGVTLYKKGEEYYIYADKDKDTKKAIKIDKEAITYCHSGLFDAKNNRILSYLHKAIKPFNQLQMLEDATVIYRISRAPERRVFYVDVGNLPKSKAEQYMRNIMTNYKNRMVYDASSGKVKDSTHHMSMMEDIWLPRREGSRGTEVSTLQAGQNLGELEDVLYFKRKLYKALHIPASRIDQENQFSVGRTNEITRDEVKFDKFVEKLRKKFSFLMKDLLRTQLILKNVITSDDWEEIKNDIGFSFASESYFSEMKEAEVMNERLERLRTVDEYIGRYFSINYVRKNVLMQSEDEIKEMDKEIENEKKEGKIPEEDEGGF